MSIATKSLAPDFIPLDLTADEPVVVRHGLGRPPAGWLAIWADAPVNFYVPDPQVDARTMLTLQ